MARGIDSSLLEPFPTVLEMPGGAADAEAVRAFFVANLQQPSFVSRAIVSSSPNGSLKSVLFVFVFGLALHAYRYDSRIILDERTFCCGENLSVRDGLPRCQSCEQPVTSAFQRTTLERDPEPYINDEGEYIEEPNVSFANFEEKLMDAFITLGIDPLNATLISSEMLTLAHNLVHSDL